jgi:hypothetical protein
LVQAMDRHVGEWKHTVDRFWQAEGPDWTEVAHLIAAIVALSDEADLRHAASQAQPSIRNAANPQDHMSRVVARRRLGVVRDVLHELTAPKFGRRGMEPEALTADERYREMLGLPLGGAARCNRDPPGISPYRQAHASGCRRRCACVPRAFRRARCADASTCQEGRLRRLGSARPRRSDDRQPLIVVPYKFPAYVPGHSFKKSLSWKQI